MSYTRGNIYTWVAQDGEEHEFINIWTTNKCETANEERYPSGIKIPMEKFDELVVMRYAEMTKQEKDNAIDNAIKNNQGNGGCYELCKQYENKKEE